MSKIFIKQSKLLRKTNYKDKRKESEADSACFRPAREKKVKYLKGRAFHKFHKSNNKI